MLKKQTVWLLTMLSLMVVLSVYYVTSDKDDLAYIDDGQTDIEETSTSETAEDGEVTDIENKEPDELFTTIRMELQNERSMEKERLNDVVASSSASTEEKNEALDDIQSIEQMDTKETILQESILETKDEYEDVLVRSNDDKVHVHIKGTELSKEEANHIMQMVNDEFGEITVDVNFQNAEG